MFLPITSYIKKKHKHSWFNIKIREKYYILYRCTKYCTSIIIFLILFFYKHIYIKKQKIKLDIDNIFELPLYENNIVFSNYSTEIKPIALYYPDFIIFNQYFNNILKYENASIEEVILKQVDLARNHGIFGFIINYVFNYNSNIYNNVLNAFHYNNKINFPFSLNWKNDNFKSLNHINIELTKFIKFIKKYLMSKN